MKTAHRFPFLLLLVLMFSCKPQVPDEYIQPDEFEDILYDFHLADGMANSNSESADVPYDVTLYRQAVLRKYGITQAEFDSSLVYICAMRTGCIRYTRTCHSGLKTRQWHSALQQTTYADMAT